VDARGFGPYDSGPETAAGTDSLNSGRVVGNPYLIALHQICLASGRNSLPTRIDFGTLGPIRNANFLFKRAHSDGRTSSHKKEQGGVR
jgi:hypothetical protein